MTKDSLQPARILVVDDDPATVTLIAETLRDEGLEVETALSGTEALARLEKCSPELMLLDLKMSGLSGQTLLQRLRTEGTLPPFIVITGQGDERTAVELMKEGALDYLVKDTTLMDILPTVVRRALDQCARDRALAATQAALQESQRKILDVVDHEQRRIGQDLHDGLGQQLTAIEFGLQALIQDLDAKDLAAQRAELKLQAQTLGQAIREATSLTRSLSRGLAPVEMEEHGLMEALEELARRTDELGAVRCRFICDSPVLIADAQTSAHLFRIAQESVANALKHAGAEEILIQLTRQPESLILQVRDNGRGLPPDRKTGAGMGLGVMRHRANVMGATLELESSPGQGVNVVCKLPVPNHEKR